MPAEHVALVSPASTGGIGRHVGALAAALVTRGHRVTVVAPASTLDRLDADGSGVVTVALDIGSASGALGRRGALRAALAGSDVVHAHGVRAAAEVALAGIDPFVATWHNAPLGGRGRRAVHAALERLGARRAAAVLAASDDLVVRARRAGARRVLLCPVAAPAHHPRRQVSARPLALDARPVVLAVARLHPQKRLDLLVRATAAWAARPDRPRLLVAGEGPERAALVAQARACGSPIELLGDRDDVDALLAAATVVVLPSDWEARPLVAQEALRAGVPLVATAVGGVPGLVGDAAVLVPAGDAAALAAALDRVLSDDGLRRRLAVAGPVQAATWPSEDETVRLIEEIYLEVTSRSSTARGG